ncbi:MAG: carboxypeptidase regulatory-like domain-containing protein [Janthinobacterium lividum]
MKKARLALGICVTLFARLAPLHAQSTTAGDLAGTLTDPTGAVIPNASVTVTNVATGEVKTSTSSSTGAFRVSLLVPGSYRVVATAPGFSSSQNTATVSAGTVNTDNLKLNIGQSGTTVEVSADPEPVNTTNGDISTVFTAEQVQSLPNPGNDLTFVAQTAPGSVMNTGTSSGGYGNFSSFGISGLSNNFTLDGGYENDPFLNLNNTGASNLTLGNNEVDTVTVISPAFSAQFGGLGGAQVNEITVSGSNRIHGDANYYWDGRATNANDWFNKQNEAFNNEQNIPVFVNANQWSASIGGPIVHDKLFWFVNTEGIRATTPVTGQVYVPNQAYQNCSLGRDPGGTVTLRNGTTQTYASCATLNAAADNNFLSNPGSTGVGNLGTGTAFAAAPTSQLPLLNTIYGVYNNSPLRGGSPITADPNDVTANTYYAKNAALLTEWLLTARLDYKIGDKDTFYIHYKQDHGTQPTYTDLIDPRFSAQSAQPAWEGQMNETHSFTPNLINQLIVTGNYYSAPFQNSNNFTPVAPSTIIFTDGDLANSNNGGEYYGGEDYAFPQGRRVSGYQVIDDVSYTKGRNTIRWGYNFRRDNITDLQGEETISPVDETSVESFVAGAYDYEHIQRFPLRLEQPVSVYNMGAYVQNEFRFTPKLTLTAGLRMERNSNPVCHTNCLQDLAYPANAIPTDVNTPYNAASPGGYIDAGRYRAFTGFQGYAPMPRVSFNYQPSTKTVIRGGFGIFTDTFPGLVADSLLSNAPTNFHAAVYGTAGGGATNLDIEPNSPNSGNSIATASAAAFETAFNTGGTYATTSAAVTAAGGHYSAPNFNTTAGEINYPTYDEYSLAVEQRLDNKSSISITYVGNHGYHEPVQNSGTNISNAHAGTGFFAEVPKAKPVTAFATIDNIYSGASSNFNGLVVSAQRRSRSLTLQFNYEYSHALDEVSNGGFEGFAPDAGDATTVANPYNLHAQYGNADYDVRQNTTGTAVWQVPSFHRFQALTGGFEFSTVAFHQTGLPYTIQQSTSSLAGGAFANGSVNLFARQLNNNFDHHCGGEAHTLLPDGSAPSPCNFVSSFGAPTDFTQQHRNTLTGPAYTNVDFGAFKVIPIPHYESIKLRVGAQFFNLFNHPNFQNPYHTLTAATGSEFGAITSTVGAPTSILGSVGGSDASPRLIQLHANLTF